MRFKPFVIWTWLLTAFAAFGADHKLAKELKDLPTHRRVKVIVRFSKNLANSDHARLTAYGALAKKKFQRFPGAVFELPASVLKILAADGVISYISEDRRINGSLEYARPTVAADVALQYGWDGAGVGVAVIDSGVNQHADLAGRVVYSENFVPGETTTADPYGHGTHVAGIIAGNATLSSGTGKIRTFQGIAPAAKIINLRVLDSYGAGFDSSVIEAIDRAITLKTQYNIRVINLSLGRRVFDPYTLDPLCLAVERAWKEGLVVVVAAGNSGRDNSLKTRGYGMIASPGNSPFVITVGAMIDRSTPWKGDDRVASYSSKGPTLLDQIAKPDLVAPGNRIVSTLAAGSNLATKYPKSVVGLGYYDADESGPSPYQRLSGTSMAAPMVAGAAALLIQKNPSLTPDTVKARLMRTATKAYPANSSYYDATTAVTYNMQSDIFTVGAGYLDIWAALNNAETLPAGKTALSPRALRDPLTGTPKLLAAANSIWGNSVLWGTSVVWGENVFVGGSSVLWGSSVVWGDSTTEGFSVLWGSSVLWGTGSVFPESLSAEGDDVE